MPASNGAHNSTIEPSAFRKEIDAAFSQVSGIVKAIQAPLSDYQFLPNDDNNTAQTGLLKDLQHMGFQDVQTLLQLFYSEVKGFEDDNTLLLEKLIVTLAKLPPTSKDGNTLTNALITNLWDGLEHPPGNQMGEKLRYREPDGSWNNIRMPQLGAANHPYARTTKPTVLQNIALPDPGAIFDLLMSRGDDFEPHPMGLSSMLFYLATLIIHDLFRTDHDDFNISTTSSYLDLAPLYGSTWDDQRRMRTFKDGKICPDCFSEKRLLGFPPGVGVLVIMFNRMHNYIVTQLALINENGRFTKPKDGLSEDAYEAAYAKYDNDLFQTGRLVNCGLYVNIILKDYVRTILSLNRTSSAWDLDPRATESKNLFSTPSPEGVGNQVSAEFNLIYRWHSAISEKDERWTQDEYAKLFPHKDPKDVTIPELLRALGEMESKLSPNPMERPFANLRRQSDDKFDDDDLVEILQSSVEDIAGSFGANRVPQIMRSVEILGIIQARAWNIATLNEFRQFFGLTKHKSFKDINPDPVVAQKLQNLYDHPDLVELYPGLVSEKAKPPMAPGSGLCVNFTISKAILSDAVALVRGDRFYTTDYTAKNLTNWGITEVQYDVGMDLGHCIYKLILRAFPNHFKGNSIYAHFPFVIPSENYVIHKNLGTDKLYSWDKPARIPELIVIRSYEACKDIMSNKQDWKVTWGEAIEYCVSQPKKTFGVDFCLAGDEKPNYQSRKMIKTALYASDWKNEVHKFYSEMTNEMIAKYGYSIGSKSTNGATIMQVDIVRDVVNLVNAQFMASVFALPIKNDANPRGIYTPQEMYMVMAVMFIAIFYDVDVANSFKVRNGARTLSQQLGELVLFNVEAVSHGFGGLEEKILAFLHAGGRGKLTDYGEHMIERLLKSGMSVKEVVWTNIVPSSAAGVANQAQLFIQCLDYYLGEGKEFMPELHRLAQDDTPEADEKLLKYFMEGSRMRHTVGLYREADVTTEVNDGDSTTHVTAGRKVFLNIRSASMDPKAFPNPTAVDITRPMSSYIHYGWGPHVCLGLDASQLALSTMFKQVLKLKNLRRAENSWGESQGVLKTIAADEGYVQYMTADQSTFFPFPTSMKVQWDA